MRILVVEDDPVTAKVLKVTLERQDYEVIAAENGRKALDILQVTPTIDLAITDLSMPEMDGLQLIAALRVTPGWEDLPVIVSSGAADRETVKKAAALGIRHFAVKPVNTAQLLATIKDLLQRNKGRSGNRNPAPEPAAARHAATAPSRPAVRVVVADDDEATRMLLEHTLTRFGYEVEAVADGNAARRALTAAGVPKLAVLDWMMPGSSGVELCRTIKTMRAADQPYLILLSARDETRDIVEGLDAGADDYLVKPFEPEELRARLHVAERSLTLRRELRQRVGHLEGVLRDNGLVGELHGDRAAARGVEKGDAYAPTRSTTSDGGAMHRVRPLVEIDRLLLRTVERISSAWSADSGQSAREPFELAGWAPLVLPVEGIWLDVVLSVGRRSAAALGAKSGDTEEGLLQSVRAGLTQMREELQAALAEHNVRTVAPDAVSVLPAESFPRLRMAADEGAIHDVQLGGMSLRLSVAEQSAPASAKPVGEVSAPSILTEAIRLPDNPGIALLNAGAVLHTRYLRRLEALATAQNHTLRLESVAPPRFARILLDG